MITAPLAPLYLSGSVQRWHANPALARSGQTLADHQGRCVILILALHPAPSVALLRSAATHDVGEFRTGDLPGDFKRLYPYVAGQHAMIETGARQNLFANDWRLTDEETAWLKLVDQLEAHAWCLHAAPAEYFRHYAGWKEAEAKLFDRAEALGVATPVRALINDLKTGAW